MRNSMRSPFRHLSNFECWTFDWNEQAITHCLQSCKDSDWFIRSESGSHIRCSLGACEVASAFNWLTTELTRHSPIAVEYVVNREKKPTRTYAPFEHRLQCCPICDFISFSIVCFVRVFTRQTALGKHDKSLKFLFYFHPKNKATIWLFKLSKLPIRA